MEFPRPTKAVHHELYAAINPLKPTLSAKGKTVFVTGGGSSIGAAIVKAFAKAGVSHIAISGRTDKTLLATKSAVENEFEHVQITTLNVDVTDPEAMDRALESIGTVDILVNNAGFLPDIVPAKDASLSEWWRGFEINVKGSFVVTQAFLKVASAKATLVNVSAGMVHTQTPMPGMSSYISSKFATAKFFQLMQQENPEKRFVNVHPGVIQSDMLEKAALAEAEDDGNVECCLTPFDYCSHVPLAGLAASFIVWVCSPEADFLKGKFVWANWDVEELKAREAEIKNTDLLTLGLVGWPFETTSKPKGTICSGKPTGEP